MTGNDNPMTALDEIQDLLTRVARVEDRLAGNERAHFRELRAKYADPCDIGFEDKILLEVMLRNVTVREDKGIQPD